MKSRRLSLLLAGVVLALGLAWLLWPRDPYALPGGDWRAFKTRFITPEGRVVDDGNGGISHSEGQGYGMLLAVAFRDRATFDRLWAWTSTHLQRKSDSLFSWKWQPGEGEGGGHVADPNNASDGDLLIAWALVRAFREWGDYRYQSAAAPIVISLFEKTLAPTWLGMQFLPGLEGFQKANGTVVNPSYYVFPAFAELATAFPSDKWAALDQGGRLLLATARFGKWKLAPDWVLVGPHWVELAPGHDPDFGYNAIRVPLHLAWHDAPAPELAPFAEFWAGLPPETPVPGAVNLRTNAFGPYAALPGMLAVRQLTLACAKSARITVRDIPRLAKEEPYYSASLKLLTKLAIRDRFGPERN